jgi:uncharacterized membrane protein YphA (DoxX/SURF4 family)
VVCVRFLVSLVFFSEGVQKFLFPDKIELGRFAKIGIPTPEFFATLDGVVDRLRGTSRAGLGDSSCWAW